jgi:hypothetical protein
VHINNNVMSSTTTNVNNSNIIKANSTTMSATIAAAAANSAASTPTNTPLYERIVSEEVRELREYVRIIETQSRRLVDLERLHVDLESRLEVEHVRSRKLERTLAQHEKKWRSVFKNLVDEKEHAERMVREEKVKVDKLMEMVNRLQTEIHALIKNKFQQHNQHGNSNIHHRSNSSIRFACRVPPCRHRCQRTTIVLIITSTEIPIRRRRLRPHLRPIMVAAFDRPPRHSNSSISSQFLSRPRPTMAGTIGIAATAKTGAT